MIWVLKKARRLGSKEQLRMEAEMRTLREHSFLDVVERREISILLFVSSRCVASLLRRCCCCRKKHLIPDRIGLRRRDRREYVW